MNSEESRLKSFDIWRNRGPISPRIMSANGFYATGNSFEVECNWCLSKFNGLELNENIEQRHISANPHCQFIVNRQQCDNIPLSVVSTELMHLQNMGEVVAINVSTRPKDNAALDLLTEKDRLATFVNWPNPNITPQSLAKAGFFYRNRSDEVQCAWCKGVIAQWEEQDNAFEEHRRFFPECPRVQLGPLIEIANDGIRDLGIQQISPPKNPKYASLQARLRTYSNWPIPGIQRPEDLAPAGLYYQKIDDQVRCFHCNMGLRSWEKDDDPWFEHAKWYPMCEFVRLVKGEHFIQEVQEITGTTQTANNPTVSITMEDAMLTEPVKLALDMGLNDRFVRDKIQQKILNTGSTFETIDDLLKALFDEEEDVNSETHESWSFNTSFAVNGNASSTNNTTTAELLDRTLCSTSTEIKNNQKLTIDKNSDNLSSKTQMNATENPSETKGKCISDRKYLEEENRKLKDARLCKVCLDEEVGVVYLPCGHLVTCVQCAPSVNQCPMCRTKIKGFVRTYLS